MAIQQTIQLVIFCIVSVLAIRGILDEVIYLMRPSPKCSKFSNRIHILSWLAGGSSVFYVLNGMSYYL